MRTRREEVAHVADGTGPRKTLSGAFVHDPHGSSPRWHRAVGSVQAQSTVIIELSCRPRRKPRWRAGSIGIANDTVKVDHRDNPRSEPGHGPDALPQLRSRGGTDVVLQCMRPATRDPPSATETDRRGNVEQPVVVRRADPAHAARPGTRSGQGSRARGSTASARATCIRSSFLFVVSLIIALSYEPLMALRHSMQVRRFAGLHRRPRRHLADLQPVSRSCCRSRSRLVMTLLGRPLRLGRPWLEWYVLGAFATGIRSLDAAALQGARTAAAAHLETAGWPWPSSPCRSRSPSGVPTTWWRATAAGKPSWWRSRHRRCCGAEPHSRSCCPTDGT